MSRRSAQRKTAAPDAPDAAAAAEEPQPILDEDALVIEEEVEVAQPVPSAPAAASQKPKKKSRAKKAAAEPEAEEAAAPEAEADPSQPAKKKRAPKKKRERAEEEEEAVPEPEPEEDQPEEEKKDKTVKRSDAGRAQGSRFDSVKVYRSQLKKHRENAPDTKKDKDGKEVPIVHRKAKQGAVAKREVKFLSKANGLYLGTALVRRMCKAAIKRAIPIVREENSRTARRLEARGKPVPQNLTVADKWSVSPGVVQLARGAIQERVNQVATLGAVLRQHTGRETILERDIATAREILRQFN